MFKKAGDGALWIKGLSVGGLFEGFFFHAMFPLLTVLGPDRLAQNAAQLYRR